MLNQSFSQDNFKIIFEIENRKGLFNKDYFSEAFHNEVIKLKEKRSEIKEYKKSDSVDEDILKLLMDEKSEVEKAKELHLEMDLQKYSVEVNQTNFNFKINSYTSSGNKPVSIYSIKNDAASFFAMKQLQHNIYRSFNVKQSNRYQIVKQLKLILSDSFPKYVVRTDIRNFYESVPQYLLLKTINENSLLSPKSKSLIGNLIYQYNYLTNQHNKELSMRSGIPRGAGASAYLAELYMKSIDNEIQSLDDVVYYSRFVDDIVIIFIPKRQQADNKYKYLSQVKDIINGKGLDLKDGSVPDEESKTHEYNLITKNHSGELNYLGYRYIINNSKLVDIKLSKNKKDKYKDRIEKIIDRFFIDSNFDSKEAHKLLIHRLNFITKNTKLYRPKKGLIGIYYTNSLIDKNCECLKELDQSLIDTIDIKLPKSKFPELNTRLKRFSFKEGFERKSFFNINSKSKFIPDLRSDREKEIRPRINNFEKIIAAWK